MELEEARMALASLARQLELSAMYGRWMILDPGKKGFETEAKLFSDAIRMVLRHAGLSDAWH